MALTTTERRIGSREDLLDHENLLEIHRGSPREKPAMSFRHNEVSFQLGVSLYQQLDPESYFVRIDAGRVRRTEETYYIPDVMVIPTAYIGPERDRPDVREIYDPPLPLVVEVWSPSTGGYDMEEKLPEYQLRGDHEVWRLHPFERTLTAWRRQPDGTFTETVFTGGRIQLWALPEVTIDLDALFDAR